MLCTSGFVDYVIFSHNGANGPESTTTCMFRPVRHVPAPGAKSAVSDCLLLLIVNNVLFAACLCHYHHHLIIISPSASSASSARAVGAVTEASLSAIYASLKLSEGGPSWRD